ncbi:MAG TPA: serine/threonine-protein kinase, partial [Verrucomicrobiota bacterium]|nr:serine/threonine-protein kinase [Verrucomicrobiota bacterium]
MQTIMIEATQCPGCGKLLPPGVLAGLCQACLLAQGAEAEPGGPVRGRFEPPPVAEVAQLFPQLEILGLLGAGGMGAVYRARQPALDRIVALKILPANGPGGAAFEERFNREARALARLSHPNIVAVFEFGRVGGLHFFIMEFVDGANLRQLEQAGRLVPREALQLIPQICDALQYAHDEGVVHRDIKPENVLVDRKGRVKIADFGLAKILGTDRASARLTAEGQVMGTPHYMAPEQIERPLAVDHRADIYSLGVVFYEMLTGDLPLGKFAPPSRKVQVDVRLDEVVLRALENDPGRPSQQAGEVKPRAPHTAETPPPAAAATAEPAVPCFHWAGFGLVEGLHGRRTINRKELLKAWAILFGFLTLALAPVSLVLGHSYLGFIGLSGFPSLIFRAGAAAVIIGLLVCWALIRPDGAAVSPPDRAWWRLVWRRAFIVTFWIAAWIVFQFNWLQPWLKARFSRSAVAQVAVAVPQTGRSLVQLPGRGTIELRALGEPGGAPNGWWRPDGRPVTNATYEVRGGSQASPPGRRSTDVLLRVLDLPDGAGGPLLETEPAAGSSGGGEVFRNGELLPGGRALRFAWPPGTDTATLRVGFGLGAWRTISTYDLPTGRYSSTNQPGDPAWGVTFHPPVDLGGQVQVTLILVPEDRGWQTQVVAVDTSGVTRGFSQARGTPTGSATTWTCTFPNLSLADVRAFQVQVRPAYWVGFADLHLVAPRSTDAGDAPPASFRRYSVGRSWAELGEPPSLVTPEQAVAAFGRRLLGGEDQAVVLAETTLGLPRVATNTLANRPEPAQAERLRRQQVASVVIYQERLAAVILAGENRRTPL